jgi:hypothetical protein
MIQWYDTANRNNGYNISLGGESGNGYKHSEEWKIEQSKRLSGEKHPMYGKQLSEETRKKISEARKGKKYPRHGKTSKLDSRAKAVICTTTGQVFYSIREANAFYNMPMKNSKISACCKDKRKSAGKTPDGKKMVWRYIDIIEL